MTTDNRTNEPTADLIAETIRCVDGSHSMGAGELGERIEAALRANGLLSEGAPTEEQIERAARAFFREYHGEDIWPELRDDGELDTRSRALAATRAALTAAGVAPQEPSRLPDFFAPKPMPNSYVPAPVLPSSGVDEETLANLIHSVSVAHFGGLDSRVAPIIASAVAELLKVQGGESSEAV